MAIYSLIPNRGEVREGMDSNISPKHVSIARQCQKTSESSLKFPDILFGVTMRCPACNKAVSIEGNICRPFCSERCRLLDLNAWLSDQYRVSVDDGIVEHDDSGDVRLSAGS